MLAPNFAGFQSMEGTMQYFKQIHTVKIQNLIINHEHILAHLSEDGREETLQEHSELCIQYLEKILERKQLYHVLQNIELCFLSDMSSEGKELFWDMFYNTISLHDMGKINCNFQYVKMKNLFFKDKYSIDCNTTNHSMLSAILYINEFYERISKLQTIKDRPKLNVFMFLNAYVISKHHGNFDSFEEFQNKLTGLDGEGKRIITDQKILYKDIYTKEIKISNMELLRKLFDFALQTLKKLEINNKETSIDIVIYERFLSSLLLSCDYYATTEFKNQTAINHFGEINNIYKFTDVFRNTSLYKKIRNYEKNEYGKRKGFDGITDINILRNEMFLDSEKVLCNNLDKDIFFLEAPTGSGKSMVSFNLGFHLLDQVTNLNKIFYVYPFNTLIEQNIDNINDIFGESECKKDIAVINSVIPMNKVMKDDEEEGDVINQNIDYVRTLLDRQFLHYPIVLTTHVSMFRYFFGRDKEALFPLAQIANSVIILDEIQSYRNEIWKEIITFLNHYAKILNIKIIIMSATLPNLGRLVDTDTKIVNLITDRNKFFLNPIFKDRVKIDFSLINIQDNIMEHVVSHIIQTGQQRNINILVEFIYRRSAYEAYDRLQGAVPGKKIMLLTSDDTSFERKQIVEDFKSRKDIILIATQVIEAGVDIDADIGYKDISLLDSEEQFIGRINRHFKDVGKIGSVYFFNKDSATTLYKQDVRKEKVFTLENEEVRKILLNKDFEVYYHRILNAIEDNSFRFDEFIKNAVNTLNFIKIEEKMRLIDDDKYKYSVFLSRIIPISDTEILNGETVWNDYIKILEDEEMEYTEKKVKLFDARTDLNYFIYKTSNNNIQYEKRIGDLFYISETDEYFKDGKFIRNSLDNDMFS